MFRSYLERYLRIAPLLMLLAACGAHIAHQCLNNLARQAIDQQAEALGVEIEYDRLRVGLTGSVQLDGVRVRGLIADSIAIAHIEAQVDLGRAVRGEIFFDRVRLRGTRIRLTEDALAPICEHSGLCESVRAGALAAPSRSSRSEQMAAGRRRSRRSAASARAPARVPRVGRLDIEQLQLEVTGSDPRAPPFVAIYDLDLSARAGVDRYQIRGGGHLVSVQIGSIPFAVYGDVSWRGDELGVVVDLERALEFDAPGATVSFEGLGLTIGAQAEASVRKLTVLPALIDFTEAWRAESVSAVLSTRAGIVPERVIVDGLKGHLDVPALSDFANWLAAEPETVDDRQLLSLRGAVIDGLSAARTALYGVDLSVRASKGDIRLRYGDGDTLSLDELAVDLSSRAEPEDILRLSYRGRRQAPDASPIDEAGRVEVRVNQLTASGIAAWTQ